MVMTASLPFYIRDDDPPAKRELLRAAMKLFSEQGLAATSIRDIAKQAGYTNPALYKHFSGKEALALHLFTTCHTRVWQSCAAAVESEKHFAGKLKAFTSGWLELIDAYPDVVAFLSDSARVLWPKSPPVVRRHTLIGLARSLVLEAPKTRGSVAVVNPDLAAATLQGTLAELARMIRVGVVPGPATRWKNTLVAHFHRLLA